MRVSRKSTLRRRKFHGRIRQQCDFLLIMKTYQTHLIHQPHVLTAAKPTSPSRKRLVSVRDSFHITLPWQSPRMIIDWSVKRMKI